MYLHTCGPWSWQAVSCHRSGSLLSPLGVSVGCGVPRVLGSSPIHVSGRWRTPPLLLIRRPGAQWGQLPWRTLFLLHKGKEQLPSFLPSGEKCLLGKINFPISVTDSQGFGAEGLLRGWTGFVLTYSLVVFCLCFWRETMQRSLPFFLQASNGLWYQMDDESVELRCIDIALRQQAYLLFYAR